MRSFQHMCWEKERILNTLEDLGLAQRPLPYLSNHILSHEHIQSYKVSDLKWRYFTRNNSESERSINVTERSEKESTKRSERSINVSERSEKESAKRGEIALLGLKALSQNS
ncbi:hypothetical protein RHMOL_Rhmol01G0175500 [Rhododendron molle]|uniref:Uncharacterized protein n=1 Tax=Rhododendron molle TaxID=49168 RepID=A0ACC0Q5U4_RHOML|nr:hypothetical protein RHMOL_Rhmol01G0175500 [Rhododendron molle]